MYLHWTILGFFGWLEIQIFNPTAPVVPQTFYPWIMAIIIAFLGVAQQACLIGKFRLSTKKFYFYICCNECMFLLLVVCLSVSFSTLLTSFCLFFTDRHILVKVGLIQQSQLLCTNLS
jgi:putative Mn2+ efflux pump MntP